MGTPYLELPSDGWAARHPRVTWARSSVHTIGYDQFPTSSIMRSLYEWDALLVFVGRILGREPLYRYADPIGTLNLAVMVEDDELGWHYDQTDFVVSLAVQIRQRRRRLRDVAQASLCRRRALRRGVADPRRGGPSIRWSSSRWSRAP